jgi:hypothetical protein
MEQLTIEQEFALESYTRATQDLTKEELQEILVDLTRTLMLREAFWKKMILGHL